MILVLAHGTFDILHPGHIKHLQAAKNLGDRLVVSLSSDKRVSEIKPGRPVFSERERRDQLLSLRCVDDVWVNDGQSGAEAIHYWKPSIFVRGIDYKTRGVDQREIDACLWIGCKLRFTDTEKLSSSDYVEMVNV